jgi:hypothetical protein
MGTISFPMLAINSDASRTVHHASVIQAVKQTVQLPKKVHKDVTIAQLLTCVVNSSRCVEHIINPLQHREKYVKAVKTDGSMKPINGSQQSQVQLRRLNSICQSVGSLIGNRSCLVQRHVQGLVMIPQMLLGPGAQ